AGAGGERTVGRTVDGQLFGANQHIRIAARGEPRAIRFGLRLRYSRAVAVGHDDRVPRHRRLDAAEQQVVGLAASADQHSHIQDRDEGTKKHGDLPRTFTTANTLHYKVNRVKRPKTRDTEVHSVSGALRGSAGAV